ncbi:hypothetical protein WKW79_32590 [Variovorax robiniae]|uniref:Uncharacterized protein n=1 Tax=Variovorax robiniae TaxID=1836199 RepID=A0ABU8XHI9_9BURK
MIATFFGMAPLDAYHVRCRGVIMDRNIVRSAGKAGPTGNPLVDSLAQLRAALVAAGLDGIEIAPRPTEGRPTRFERMLDEDYGPAPTPLTAPERKATL